MSFDEVTKKNINVDTIKNSKISKLNESLNLNIMPVETESKL